MGGIFKRKKRYIRKYTANVITPDTIKDTFEILICINNRLEETINTTAINVNIKIAELNKIFFKYPNFFI